jgi:hypothetical protein
LDLEVTEPVLALRQVDWNKGHALLHLLAAMGLDGLDDVLPIYIGDDRTDEDAFKALKGRARGGCGILVSSKARRSAHVMNLLGSWHDSPCSRGEWIVHVPSQTCHLFFVHKFVRENGCMQSRTSLPRPSSNSACIA